MGKKRVTRILRLNAPKNRWKELYLVGFLIHKTINSSEVKSVIQYKAQRSTRIKDIKDDALSLLIQIFSFRLHHKTVYF
jgi:hypothetical protein